MSGCHQHPASPPAAPVASSPCGCGGPSPEGHAVAGGGIAAQKSCGCGAGCGCAQGAKESSSCEAGCACAQCSSFYKDGTAEDVIAVLPWLGFHRSQDFIDLHLKDVQGPPVSKGTCSHGMPLSLEDDVLEMLDEQTEWAADFEAALQEGGAEKEGQEGARQRLQRSEAEDEFWTNIFHGCVCLEYKKWYKDYGISKYDINIDPVDDIHLSSDDRKQSSCWPLWRYNQREEIFTVWWNSAPKGKKAVDAVFGLNNGKRQLFDSILNSGFLDNENFGMNEFDEMLKTNDWDKWDMNYKPMFSDAPRREMMKTALWLIASMENGFIDSFDRFENIKDDTWKEIVDNKMKYKLYGPKTRNPVYKELCHGAKGQELKSMPTPNREHCHENMDCHIGQTDFEPINRKYIMHGNMRFDFEYIEKDGDVFSGNNHGASKASRTVHFCTIQIDRMAVMYDWYMTLAASHMLAAGEAGNPNQAENHLKAQNLCLRMALSVLVWAAELILHETGHNLDLWHCDKNFDGDNKASCIQDVIAYVWRAHTMARLGLSRINFDDDIPTHSTLMWDRYLGYSTTVSDFEGHFVDFNIQCKAERTLPETWEKILEILATALSIAAALLEILIMIAKKLKLGVSFEAILALLALIGIEIAIEKLDKVLTENLGDPIPESLHWGVDYPLIMGGNLKICVFTSRPQECNPTPFTDCFQKNLPDEFVDCEYEVMNGKENSFD